MRIVIDGRAYFQRTGIGRYTRGLVHALTAHDSAHRFLLLISDHHRPKEIALPPNVTIRVSKAPWLGGARERTALSREVREWRGDLFHSVFPPMTVAGVPSIVTVFDLIPLTHPHLHTSRVVRSFRGTAYRALSRADRILAISAATGASVCDRFPTRASRIRVVPCGVDALGPASRRAARKTRRRRGMLYVGTIEPRKNVPLVVAAARRLHENGHRIPLTIVGKPGWGGYDLERDIATLPDVRYRGFVDDATLRRLYREAATFVYPSTVEGFGLPVVEAMGHGAVPIVSADPALREVVGDADLVLPNTTPQALADAVLRWSRPSAERARKRRALARRARTFSWDRAASAVLGIYDELG